MPTAACRQCGLNLKNDAGDNVLHVAISNKNCCDHLILHIIQSGVDVNTKNQHGSTPPMEVIELGRKDVAKALINAGADVNARAKNGHGSNVCDLTVKRFLKKLCESSQPKHQRVLLPYSMLLPPKLYGIDIRDRCCSSMASELRFLEEILIALIDGGLNYPNDTMIGDSADEGVLDTTTRQWRAQVVTALFGREGSGVVGLLHLAVLWRMRELVTKLLVSGVNVNMTVYGGNTALHVAYSSTHCNDNAAREICNLLDDHMKEADLK